MRCQCEACWATGSFRDAHVCKRCGRSRSHGPCACSFDVPLPMRTKAKKKGGGVTGEDNTARAWRERWKVSITCRDCGASWECAGVSASLERIDGFNRMFLAGGPEVCHECKNLKVAAEPDAESREGRER